MGETVSVSDENWPRRDAAMAALAERDEPERHVSDGPVTVSHGHPGFCCCLSQLCRSDLCNVNAQIVRDLSDAGGRVEP